MSNTTRFSVVVLVVMVMVSGIYLLSGKQATVQKEQATTEQQTVTQDTNVTQPSTAENESLVDKLDKLNQGLERLTKTSTTEKESLPVVKEDEELARLRAFVQETGKIVDKLDKLNQGLEQATKTASEASMSMLENMKKP